ncbi:MAG: hypothetical protein ACOZQL_01110 [Myxococcota bacterium]
MSTLLSLLVLAQVVPVGGAGAPKAAEPVARTFSDGRRSYTLYEGLTLVAEPSPSSAGREAVLAVDPSATVALERPTMRIWKVRDAAAVRARVVSLRPVFHDVPSGAGRYRVPMGLVCGGERRAAAWLEVLERSGAGCLPDFWYPPVLR